MEADASPAEAGVGGFQARLAVAQDRALRRTELGLVPAALRQIRESLERAQALVACPTFRRGEEPLPFAASFL